MDRSSRLGVEYHPSMRIGRPTPFDVVLPNRRRNGRELSVDAFDRRAVSQDAVLWKPEAGRNVQCQSQAYSTTDAIDGDRGNLCQEANDLAGHRSQDLPVLTPKCCDCSPRSSMEYRHHVFADAARLFVSGGGDRLVQSLCPQLETFQYARHWVLSGGVR